MILIFGGAYQGKLDFAKEKFNMTDDDVFFCTEYDTPDFTKKIIYNMDLFFLKCIKENIEPKEIIIKNRDILDGKIIIVNEISQGIVPIDKELRAWREAAGRAMAYLAQNSSQVYRIFCGLSQQMK